VGEPADYADVIVYLCAGAAYITGEVIPVTGGIRIGYWRFFIIHRAMAGPQLRPCKDCLMTRNERLTARLDGNFVVFLIGLRINKPLHIHKWLPVMQAMPRMIGELMRQPELGLLHAATWFSRTTLMVQYWRSLEQLLDYAQSKDAHHLPAWRAFNQSVGTNGSVGIWHETYTVSPGTFESVYVNMPPFGLGRAGTLWPATGKKLSASGRLSG
jgi:hypothetical protein